MRFRFGASVDLEFDACAMLEVDGKPESKSSTTIMWNNLERARCKILRVILNGE